MGKAPQNGSKSTGPKAKARTVNCRNTRNTQAANDTPTAAPVQAANARRQEPATDTSSSSVQQGPVSNTDSMAAASPSTEFNVHIDGFNGTPAIDPQLLTQPVIAAFAPPLGVNQAPTVAFHPTNTPHNTIATNTLALPNTAAATANATAAHANIAAGHANGHQQHDETIALLLDQVRRLEERFQAGEQSTSNSTGGPVQGTSNTARLAAGPQSIPKPKGSAGGGRRGFHLQAEMGLADDEEGQRRYNMILATIRELAHAARLDLSCPYRHVTPENLNKIFSSARKLHPYLARFENDWATAEILKQYLSSARRYGRRKGYFDCGREARRRGGNFDDFFDGDNGGPRV